MLDSFSCHQTSPFLSHEDREDTKGSDDSPQRR